MKQLLAAQTPVGSFTRRTDSKYTHCVVWNSPRAMDAFNARKGTECGVHGRWVKDGGYGVTWHGSEAAACAAARKGYGWDSAATLAGVFPVVAR